MEGGQLTLSPGAPFPEQVLPAQHGGKDKFGLDFLNVEPGSVYSENSGGDKGQALQGERIHLTGGQYIGIVCLPGTRLGVAEDIRLVER